MKARKPGIPPVSSFTPDLARILGPMKENIEILTGVRGGGVRQLADTASNAEVIAKLNEIIARINSTGD